MNKKYIKAIVSSVDHDALVLRVAEYLSMYDKENKILDLFVGESPFINKDYIEQNKNEILQKVLDDSKRYRNTEYAFFAINPNDDVVNGVEVSYFTFKKKVIRKDDNFDELMKASAIIEEVHNKVLENPIYMINEDEKRVFNFVRSESRSVLSGEVGVEINCCEYDYKKITL